MKTKPIQAPFALPLSVNPAEPFVIIEADGRSFNVLSPGTSFSEDAERSAYLTRACNAHADLLAALERFVGYADQHTHTEVLDEIATQARAALEKAGRGVEGGGE